MDADEISKPERFVMQIDFLDIHSEVDVLGAYMTQKTNRGEVFALFQPHIIHERIIWKMTSECVIAHPTVKVIKDLRALVVGYNEKYQHEKDTERWYII